MNAALVTYKEASQNGASGQGNATPRRRPDSQRAQCQRPGIKAREGGDPFLGAGGNYGSKQGENCNDSQGSGDKPNCPLPP